MAMNDCSFTGRFTADPDLRLVGNSQVEKVTFTLAVDRDRKNEDGSRTADFFDFIAWRATAKFICDNFKKGDQVTVVHTRATVREYTDKDGNKRRKYEYDVSSKSDIYFGAKRRERHEEPVKEEYYAIQEDDSYPFDMYDYRS